LWVGVVHAADLFPLFSIPTPLHPFSTPQPIYINLLEGTSRMHCRLRKVSLFEEIIDPWVSRIFAMGGVLGALSSFAPRQAFGCATRMRIREGTENGKTKERE
jgi:hypothetical protein